MNAQITARSSLLLVATIGLLWGLNWPAVKFILQEIPPWTLRAIGFVCAAALLALAAILSGQRLYVARNERFWLTIAGLLTVFGFNVFTAFGQLLTETTNAVIIAFTMPMWATLLSIFYLNETLSSTKAWSLVTGMIGLAILLQDQMNVFLAEPTGVLFMLGAAISWAAGTIVLKARQWVTPKWTQAAWMLGCSAIPAVAISISIESPKLVLGISWPVSLALVFHILFPMVVCYAIWVELVARLPVSVVTLGTLLIPVVGVISASLFLGETITIAKTVALLLVLSSIAAAMTTGAK